MFCKCTIIWSCLFFFFFFCFGGVGSSCPRVCVPVQLNIFMLPCVLLEGNLTVCVAFVFFVCFFFSFLFV